jgi:gamma-glutamylputrescine oxidase
VSTEPLSDELIERISPLRGAFSDIRPVINYYRVTRENRLLFGSATRFVEYTPNDFAAWNHPAGGGLPLSEGCEDRFRLGRADGL